MPKYVRLKFPPGVVRNGTRYEQRGRWWKANLVRWSENVMRPIGGWTKVLDGNSAAIDVTDPIRGVFVWRDDANAVRFLYGTYDKVYHLSAGTETDLTPAGFTAGGEDSVLTSGQYDVGNYDEGLYGEGDEGSSTLTEANTWQFDNYGPIPIAFAYSEGTIMDWDLNVANNFAAVTNAPTSCLGMVVSAERMIVALGAGGFARRVAWCDQADRTVWTAASSNTAGLYELPGQGMLMCGKRLPTETLILSEVDAFAMRYIGGSLIYRFDQVGSNCGAISRQALTTAEGRAFWMGKRGFFKYEGGFAQPIPCPISDEVFNNLNSSQRAKVAAWSNARFHEVWFSYPFSDECDRVVCYNYLENHWSGPWTLARTSGADAGAHTFPVMADPEGALLNHETGESYLDTDDATALVPSAESGPFEIGDGDRVMTVNRYIPDEHTVGDVDVDIYAALYPHRSQGGAINEEDTEDSQSVTIGAISDVRLTGRQVRLGITQDNPGWVFGTPRLEVIQRGRR